jgi:hypothetical protein
VRVVLKLIVLISIFTLLFSNLASAQAGMGIWPSQVEIEIPFLKTGYTEINLFNPTKRNINLTISFECENCEKSVEFFGKKIGSVNYLLEVEISPRMLELLNLTQEKVLIKISNPLFLKGIFRTKIFGREVVLPVYLLSFDKNEFKGKIIATTQETQLAISIVSKLSIDLIGINRLIFFMGLVLIIFIASLIYREYVKKISLEYE